MEEAIEAVKVKLADIENQVEALFSKIQQGEAEIQALDSAIEDLTALHQALNPPKEISDAELQRILEMGQDEEVLLN